MPAPDQGDALTVEELAEAIRIAADQTLLRSAAKNPDLRVGHTKVVHVFAIDIADLIRDPLAGWARLQALRGEDALFGLIKDKLPDKEHECTSREPAIRERGERAENHGGKAVWTEQFLKRFAPITLPVQHWITVNDLAVERRGRLRPDSPNSQLHHVELLETALQMFPDGTICFTMTTRFNEGTPVATHGKPPPVMTVIERLRALDKVAGASLKEALAYFLQRAGRALEEVLDVELKQPGELRSAEVLRRAKSHTAIFVEQFYYGDKIEALYGEHGYDGARNASAAVSLDVVLLSSSLPGLLNTATWYSHYNSRYVTRLIGKEIGYRDDEIYLTDRKATVVSAAGFFSDDDEEPLLQYFSDIVFAVEYNVARLAYFASTLAYYQEHEDVRALENTDPGEALQHVIRARSILSSIVESLDLTLLVNHGFTRLFIERLRKELGFPSAVARIRERVEDASTSVELKASVDAAANTSKLSLAAARETNELQKKTSWWAKLSVAVAVLLAVLGWVVAALNFSEEVKLPDRLEFCLQQQSADRTTAMVCPKK
jgi:hypothetical protein